MVNSYGLTKIGIEAADFLLNNFKEALIYEKLTEFIFHEVSKIINLEQISFYVIDDEMENLKEEAIYNNTGWMPNYDFIPLNQLSQTLKDKKLHRYKGNNYHFLRVPLYINSQLLGLMEIRTISSIDKEKEIEIKAMARVISLGLRSVLFERDTIREKENTEFSVMLNNMLQSIGDLDQLINVFLEMIVNYYKFDLVTVLIFNEEREIGFCRGIDERGRLFTINKFPDLPDLSADYITIGDNLGYWVPLKTNTGVVGVILFYNLYTLYKIPDSLLNTLRILSSQLANALDNIRMFSSLQRSAFYDSLTGLYNRTYFDKILLDLKEKEPLFLSIIIGDLNGLKITNDVFGHGAGDDLLIEIAEIIKESCPEEALIFRWGGDEFFMFLPDIDEEEVLKICQTIKERCSRDNNTVVPLSISLGHATGMTKNGEMSRLIKLADDRMYRHKLLDRKNYRKLLISSLKDTLAEKSYESAEHSERMAKLAVKIGRKMGLAGSELEDLKLLAMLHDLGKVVISKNILKKKGALSKKEWEEIKKHPEAGYRISQASTELSHISNYILYHHERWDGKGYPLGMKGEEIPLLSRIISVVDAYDVMTYNCSYKKTISHEEAIKELERCAGTQLDPDIVQVFCSLNFD